jgi:hypothetical protein
VSANNLHKVVAVCAVAAVLATYGVTKWWSQYYVAQAGFWCDQVTYELPHLRAAGLGGPLAVDEQETIEATAWAEVRAAFSGLRVEVTDNREARYKVRVVQHFPASRGTGAAGESRVLRPLGGAGAVNFLMLGSQAIAYAPPDADRQTVVVGVGRGIGRAAVHEFAHQLVPNVAIHESQDPTSYEFSFSSRPAQYYGNIRWDTAWPALVAKFGPIDRTRAATLRSRPE